MIPLSSATSSAFTWSRSLFKETYDLKLNGNVLAALRRTDLFSSTYEATTANSVFKFQRAVWCGAKGEIVDCHSQRQVAFFKSPWADRVRSHLLTARSSTSGPTASGDENGISLPKTANRSCHSI
jgi:hypothetical protein